MDNGQPDPQVDSTGRLGGKDAGQALLAYLAAQALVWVTVGVIVLARAGTDAGQAVLLRELATLIPLAMPASLLASGVALLLVLVRWRKRIGGAALAQTLGWSLGTRR